MVKTKRFTAFLMVTAMIASALMVMLPSAFAAVDGTAFYDEDYSGTAADNWIEISGTGTELISSSGYYGEHHITYSFSMYGDSFTEVTIGDAGAIRMGYQTSVTSNTNYPSTSSSHRYEIAVWADYLDIHHSYAHLYYEIQGTKLIVQWQNVVYRATSSYGYGDYTFQVILDNDDGSIRFNYLSMNPDTYTNGEFRDSATVGLNKGYDGEYEEYYYDSSYFTVGYDGIRPVSGDTILYYSTAPPFGVSIDGPTEVDEGTSSSFFGTIAGYGGGTPAGYDIDDTRIETFFDATGGTLLRSTYGDDSYNTLSLPFDFEYFGVLYPMGTTLYVGTNGYMDFGSPNTDHTDYTNTNIPDAGTYDPNNAAYVYWDDLVIRGSSYDSYIYYDVGVSAGHVYLVIEWYNVFSIATYANPGTFEVVLWDNGIIDFRYLDVDMDPSSRSNGASATVGLENQDGTAAAKYSYNTASLSDGMNIRYEFLPAEGIGYEWYYGTTLIESGSASTDPFYTSISYPFEDGPAIETLDLVATVGGSPIDSASITVTVNNLPPEVSIDQGTTEPMELGETILIDGDIDDVPADTFTYYAEVTPGVEGEDWILTPTTPSSTLDEFGYDFAAIRPGVYTLTVHATDDDGDSDSASVEITVSVPSGALEITDVLVLPEDLQAGGMTLVYVDVINTIGLGHWHQLEDGEWWCGDDATGEYDDDWLDALVFEDIMVPTDGAMEVDMYIDSSVSDGGNVQISTDGGESWSLIHPEDGYPDSSIPGLDSPYDDAPGFTRYSTSSVELFDLSAYEGMTVDIRFVFGSGPSFHAYDSWTIYSVEIGTLETTVIPGSGWSQVIHSGTGEWQWVPYSEYHYTDPPGTGAYYIIADSDDNPSDVYDVGAFSPSMDMTAETSVTVTYARDFQDFAGDGYMEVNTYSGGVFEETLFSKTTDDSSGGLVDSHTFNPSGYTDPSSVQLEFLYSTEGGTYAWGFGLDDVVVTGGMGTIFSEDFETLPFDIIGGLVFTPTADVTDSGFAVNLKAVYVELPLSADDLVLDMPDGWSVLGIKGPDYLGSTESASLVSAISVPPGTAVGEYDIKFSIPYVSMAWPGDLNAGDDTEHYIPDIGFDFPFYPNAVPTPPTPGDAAWWCGEDSLGTYGPSYQDALVFQVTLGAGELLTIDHDMDGFISWDGGNLQVFDGTTWQLVYPTSGFMYDGTSISGLDSPYTNAPGWCQTMARVTSSFDLGVGTHDVRLVFGSTTVVHYRGWGIFSVMAGTNDITATGVPTNLNAGPSNWHMVTSLPPPTSPARTGGGTPGPYGGTWSDITVSPNGAIVMGQDTSISLSNTGFPTTTSTADLIIAPFWDDMNANNRGSVSFNSDGSRAIITWYEIPHYSDDGTYSFQCILYPNGDIQFNYLLLDEYLDDDSPTVGMNLGDGTHGTEYYYESYSSEYGTRPTEMTSILFTYDGDQYVATEIPFEWVDFGPKITVNVCDKMTGDELSFYRHTQNAIKTIVILAMNLEDGMEDDGSLDSGLADYKNCALQESHSTTSAANAHGHSWGWWMDEGGMAYFLNPGRNGNGMAGMPGSEAVD